MHLPMNDICIFVREQGVGSGACVATVLLKDGALVAANVGDCRVVVSRNGTAHALTSDHRAGREDERIRIENTAVSFLPYRLMSFLTGCH